MCLPLYILDLDLDLVLFGKKVLGFWIWANVLEGNVMISFGAGLCPFGLLLLVGIFRFLCLFGYYCHSLVFLCSIYFLGLI